MSLFSTRHFCRTRNNDMESFMQEISEGKLNLQHTSNSTEFSSVHLISLIFMRALYRRNRSLLVLKDIISEYYFFKEESHATITAVKGGTASNTCAMTLTNV